MTYLPTQVIGQWRYLYLILQTSTHFKCQAHKRRFYARRNKALVFWPKTICSDMLFPLASDNLISAP